MERKGFCRGSHGFNVFFEYYVFRNLGKFIPPPTGKNTHLHYCLWMGYVSFGEGICVNSHTVHECMVSLPTFG